MAAIDDVLTEIRMLKSWLYGANGHEGDVPEMKQRLRDTCDAVIKNTQDIAVLNHKVKKASSRSKKELGASGGIGAVIGAATATLIDFFLRR